MIREMEMDEEERQYGRLTHTFRNPTDEPQPNRINDPSVPFVVLLALFHVIWFSLNRWRGCGEGEAASRLTLLWERVCCDDGAKGGTYYGTCMDMGNQNYNRSKDISTNTYHQVCTSQSMGIRARYAEQQAARMTAAAAATSNN